MSRHHPPPPPKTSFLSFFCRIFFSKTGNLRQNIRFSENCVAIWRFFAKKTIHCSLGLTAELQFTDSFAWRDRAPAATGFFLVQNFSLLRILGNHMLHAQTENWTSTPAPQIPNLRSFGKSRTQPNYVNKWEIFDLLSLTPISNSRFMEAVAFGIRNYWVGLMEAVA